MTPRGQILLVLTMDLTESESYVSVSRGYSTASSQGPLCASLAAFLPVQPFCSAPFPFSSFSIFCPLLSAFLSISFAFNRLRTLFDNGAIATPFLSITCALFPMQWGGWGIFSRSVYPELRGVACTGGACTPKCHLLFSTTYTLPNLQALCFDDVATVGWGGRVRARA